MIYRLYRLPGFIIIVSAFILISFCVDRLIRDVNRKRLFFSWITHRAAQALLWLLGIKSKINKATEVVSGKLIICNHLSYVDIVVIAAHLPTLFITSVEVQKDPFLGLLAKFGGSLFIERRNRSQLLLDIDKVGDVLKEGHNVVLFPEGTSSKGFTVLPFKSALFMAAIRAGTEVMPLCCRYKDCRGVAYYGNHKFFPHLLHLLTIPSIEVALTVLPMISGCDRETLAKKSFEEISRIYNKYP